MVMSKVKCTPFPNVLLTGLVNCAPHQFMNYGSKQSLSQNHRFTKPPNGTFWQTGEMYQPTTSTLPFQKVFLLFKKRNKVLQIFAVQVHDFKEKLGQNEQHCFIFLFSKGIYNCVERYTSYERVVKSFRKINHNTTKTRSHIYV